MTQQKQRHKLVEAMFLTMDQKAPPLKADDSRKVDPAEIERLTANIRDKIQRS